MFGKSQPPRQPKLAGMDELDIVTNETDVPVPYFAGQRRLDVSWIMPTVIDHTTSVDSGSKSSKSGKSGGSEKNYFGHCAGLICQGQLDFIVGLLINNELVFPNAAIWDSQIFHTNRIIIYTDGNAYKITVETDQVPPNFPWTLYALAWTAGSYALGTIVVANGNMLFKSLIGANTTTPPATAVSNADWQYLSSPDLWSGISSNHFWDVGSIVAWEGQVYQTATATNNEPPNAPWTLYRQLESASANPYLMTVAKSTRFGTNAGPGDWYLYWGLANQVLDTVGEQILHALGHPPYRNCAVIMGKNIKFGTQTVQPPSVQVLAGRAPVQTLITGASALLDSRWTANPWCVLAELLTHPIYGLGLPTSWFDLTSWQAEADRCATNPQFFYISPMYTSLKKVGELAADLLGYPDAFIFWSTIATIMAGHWPHGEAAPAFTAANTINRNNIIKEFVTQSEGWWGTANSIAVTVSDIQAGFKSRPCLASNLFNMTVTKRLLSMKIDRPYITDYNQGLAWAHEFAKISGDQSSSGTIELQSEKATGAKPGSLFLLTDDVLGTSEVQRCTKRVISAPPKGISKITHETERGVAPQPFQPTSTNPAQAAGPSPALITNYAVIQLPAPLAGETNTLAVISGRENGTTSSLQVWFRKADGVAFQQLGTNTSFAVAGWFDAGINTNITYGANSTETTAQLGAVTQGNSYAIGDTGFWKYVVSYSSSSGYTGLTTAVEGTDYLIDPVAGELTIITGGGIATGKYVEVQYWNTLAMAYDPNTPSTDVDNISTALTQDQINDNDLLIFAVQANDPTAFEIMSVRSVQAVGTDSSGGPLNGDPVLFLKVVRGQFGSPLGGDGSYIWGTNPGDQIFVIPRASVNALSNLAFEGLADNGSTAAFILAPESAWVTASISDIYDVANNPSGLATEFNYTFGSHYPPVISVVAKWKNGVPITAWFTSPYLLSDLITLLINATDANANLAHLSIIGLVGDQKFTLYSQNLPPQPSQNVLIALQSVPGAPQFPFSASWRLEVTALDIFGNHSTLTIPEDYPDTSIFVDALTNTSPSPTINTYEIVGGQVTGLTFGKFLVNGYTLHWQIKPRGTPPDAQGSVNYTANPTWNASTLAGNTVYTSNPIPTFPKGTKTLYAYMEDGGTAQNSVTVAWNIDQ